MWLEIEKVTMDGQSFAMFGWSWTDESVLGSEVFGQALMYSCDSAAFSRVYCILYISLFRYNLLDTWSARYSIQYSGKFVL